MWVGGFNLGYFVMTFVHHHRESTIQCIFSLFLSSLLFSSLLFSALLILVRLGCPSEDRWKEGFLEWGESVCPAVSE